MTFDPQTGVSLGPHTVLFWFSARRLGPSPAFSHILAANIFKHLTSRGCGPEAE